ncbi:MAG: HU family DNA-binding protein [Magnetococcales bacterium]|nr:HU family DNA-binding protein [Magnetococcales bacterium]NGZ28920.1 HU family DNA-binding protein [Magnetococcales bacterium]
MNKRDLVQKLAQKTGFNEKIAGEALTTTLDVIQDALIRGDRVSLIGFGAFEVTEREARPGRNPQTGEPITIPASKVLRFRAGKSLKEAVA